jgi:hypothetical protein
LKVESIGDSGVLEGVTARIHGLAVVLRLLSV